MTLRKIFDLGLIDDDTEVWVRDSGFCILTHGNWNQGKVLRYLDSKLRSFTWKDDNNLYIDMK